MPIRRKCFISYHHDDQREVDAFIQTFDTMHNVFIARGLGQAMAEDVINSGDTDYVMRRIRELYLGDSTVTIVLMGKCTWARRYVDWEIQSSLRSGDMTTPNGLLGVKLPGFTQFPDRFNQNLTPAGGQQDTNYAGWIDYPITLDVLQHAIEWAFARRTTHAARINNPRERFVNNRFC